MATLKEIKTRIGSVKNTQQITKAVKMVAAAKMRRAQERMFSARPYAFKIRELIQSLAANIEEPSSPLFDERPVERVTIVVITSDRGLCGSFNSNVIKKAVAEYGRFKDKDVSLVCLGRKGYEFFKKREYPIRAHEINFFNSLQYQHAQGFAKMLVADFLSGEADTVQLIYNEFKSAAQQILVSEQLLPLSVEAGGVDDQANSGPAVDYLYEPSEEAILNALLPRHLNMQMWRALLESYASEQAARMIAMENATENANELIQNLTLQYNKARQAAITTEILEIVGGAEALKNA